MPLPKILTTGQGSDSSWHPTVIYLLLFIIAEMVVFGLISKALR